MAHSTHVSMQPARALKSYRVAQPLAMQQLPLLFHTCKPSWVSVMAHSTHVSAQPASRRTWRKEGVQWAQQQGTGWAEDLREGESCTEAV